MRMSGSGAYKGCLWCKIQGTYIKLVVVYKYIHNIIATSGILIAMYISRVAIYGCYSVPNIANN